MWEIKITRVKKRKTGGGKDEKERSRQKRRCKKRTDERKELRNIE